MMAQIPIFMIQDNRHQKQLLIPVLYSHKWIKIKNVSEMTIFFKFILKNLFLFELFTQTLLLLYTRTLDTL